MVPFNNFNDKVNVITTTLEGLCKVNFYDFFNVM